MNFVAEGASDRASQQRVVGAAEHERVDSACHHRIEITFDRQVGQFIVEQAFFDQWHEQWAGNAADANMHIERAQRIFIGAAANGCTRPDDADVTITRHRDGSLRPRLNHADNRDCNAGPQFWNRHRRNRIAGDNNQFCIFRHQYSDELEAVTLDCFGTFISVGDARGIAEVENVFVRQKFTQGPDHGEPADAGIEYPNRFHLLAARSMKERIFAKVAVGRRRRKLKWRKRPACVC